MRDEALERAFARCEAAAFERAYERFGPRMYAAALRVLRNASLAQECVQDVMLRLWKSGGGYSPARGNLEAFLVVCARNAALTRVRDDARRRELLALSDPPTETVNEDPFEHEPMHRAIRLLPAAQTQAIELAYYKGLTHAEIAAQLNEPLGTVKSRISAALRALRSTLGKEVNE